MPNLGETLEAHFILKEVSSLFMECDYVEHEYVDLATLRDVIVKSDMATTYIHIESSNHQFQISGYLSYNAKMRGNNMIVYLPGKLKVKFFDAEEGEDDQEIEI